MLTLLGAGLIVTACGFAGQRGAAALAEHRCRLLGAEQGIHALCREIGYLATPLVQAFTAAAEAAGTAGPLFRNAACLLAEQDGISGEEAWRLALKVWRVPLKPAEYGALDAVGAGLGKTDAELQLQHLALAAERVRSCEKDTAEREARFGKLWRSMGWACGAVLVLLLW